MISELLDVSDAPFIVYSSNVVSPLVVVTLVAGAAVPSVVARRREKAARRPSGRSGHGPQRVHP